MSAASNPLFDSEVRWAARGVLLDPMRLRILTAGGMENALALRQFFAVVVPLARREVHRLDSLAQRIPDQILREKALMSLHAKAYHIAGACVLASFLPSGAREHYVEIVAPLEALYDFLDTLCDRDPQPGPQASLRLHQALADALHPGALPAEYFAFGPAGDDGDYLRSLVQRVRRPLQRLAGYEALVPVLAPAAAMYAQTQTFKHLPAPQREPALRSWFESSNINGLEWFEYAAAAGSQFHVYGALYAAFCSRFDLLDRTYAAYFPEVAAVHVLLDAFIDRDEDAAHGELNFVACYGGEVQFEERMEQLVRAGNEKFGSLPLPAAHRFALRMMLLFYLTHPKIHAQRLDRQASALLRVTAAKTI